MTETNTSELFSQIQGLNAEQLQEMMKTLQKSLKEQKVKQSETEEQEYAEKLDPYESELKAIRESHDAEIVLINKQITELKERKKISADQFTDKITNYLMEYNKVRTELGLRPKTLRGSTTKSNGPRAARSGDSHHYDLDWIDDSYKTISVTINKDESKKFNINIEDGVAHVKDIENAMTSFGIDIGSGGKCRGVANRIRKEYLKVHQTEPTVTA